MDELYVDALEFLKKPVLMEAFVDILMSAVPIWVAVMIGLVIGWSWRPRWTGIIFLGLRSRFRFVWTDPPGLGARRLSLAFTALSASLCRRLWSKSSSKDNEEGSAAAGSQSSAAATSTAPTAVGSSLITGPSDGDQEIVTEKDLEHLINLLEGKVGDAMWQN